MSNVVLPHVTVVIPVYNTPVTWLQECLDSVYAQKGVELSVVIVDDGSTQEGIIEFLETVSASKKPVTCYRQPHKGVAYQRNVGLDAAETELIAVMDSDDVMLPNRLMHEARFIEEVQADVISGQIIYCSKNLKREYKKSKLRYDPSKPMNLQRGNPIAHGAAMYRKTVVQSVGGYNINKRTAVDWDLWLRLDNVKAKFHVIDVYLLKYRLHEKQMRWQRTRRILRG